MAEPGAMHERFQGVTRLPQQLVTAADDLLEEIGDRLQPALLFDETVDDVIEHGRSPFPGQAVRKIVSAQAPGSSQPLSRRQARAASARLTSRKRTVSPGRACARSGRSAVITVAITG